MASDHAFAKAMNAAQRWELARKQASQKQASQKQEGPPRMQAGDPSIVSMRFP
jgi:hypothetical protein